MIAVNSEHEADAHTPATRPAPKFDRLAGIYRWMEHLTFGPFLARCRFAFLLELAARRRALVLGDGDGRFTARLLQANRIVEVDAVDASQAMLDALLRRAAADAARVHAYCADARDWQAGNVQYDLVASHFFLDCLTTGEVSALAARVRRAVSPSACWVISEFAVPQGCYGRFIAGPLVWLLYRAFGVMTGLAVRSLPDHAAALRGAGFTLEERRTWLRGLLAAEFWRVSSGESDEI
jgi:SAM-dependent methyltransferase